MKEIILTKDGQRLFSGGLAFEYGTKRENFHESKQVKVWNVKTGKLIKTLPTEWPVSHLALSEDEEMIVSLVGHTLELRKTENWDLLGTINLGIRSSIKAATFSPDGQTLVISRSSSGETGVELIDLRRLSEVAKSSYRRKPLPPPMKVLPGNQSRLFTLAFHPDGRTLLSHGVIATALLFWDICSPNSPIEVGKHPNLAITLSDDGKLVVTAGYSPLSKTENRPDIKVWELP